MSAHCGTTAGYSAHRRRNEPTCPACRAAAAAYERRRSARAYITRGEPLVVDATGTGRRLRALMRIGWSLHDLARRVGMPVQSLSRAHHRDRVAVSTAEKVAALYDELSMTLGPSVYARRYGAERGWLPPLCWSDEEIDDPKARPSGLRTGHEPRRQNRDAEREAQVWELTRCGVSAADIAVRLRCNKRYVERVRARYREDQAS